jgi:hypothetical protein
MKSVYIALLLSVASWCLAARPLPPGAQQEVEHLIEYLEQSGCRFNRNGTWYPAGDAKQHLNKKYAYLIRKDMLTTTESFIELAASRSSVSGKPYLVQCGASAPQPSGDWFREELQRWRQSKS